MKTIGIICFLVLPLFVFGQSYSERFDEAFKSRDTVLQRSILTNWWLDNSHSPDLAVAQFLFHKERYISEGDSTIRQTALAQAFSAINDGIFRYPDRLDMRFYKISLLGELSEFEEYTQEIVAVFDRNDSNSSEWLWKRNASLSGAPEFILEYVDNYVILLYNRQDPALHGYMDDISNRVLVAYPNHVSSLSNLAITAMYRKDYDSGIAHLVKATAIDGTNTSILSNLAYAYEQIGDIAQAITYYERIVEYGDSQAKNYANQRLERLKLNN